MKSNRIEQLLNSFPNVIWEYRPTVLVDKIDRKKSHELQVRVGQPLIRNRVEEYTLGLKNGVEFPALVCYESDDNTLVNLDGNQRTEAFLAAKRATCDAYVILTDDPLTRTRIAYRCNVLNGESASEEDRLVHAMNFVNQGMKVTDAAAEFNISTTRLQKGISDFNGQVRARRHGVQSDWNRIDSKDMRVRIHNSIKLDSVFILTVKYTGNFKPGYSDISSIVTRIIGYSSEEDQLKCIRGIIAAAERARREAIDNRGSYLKNPINVMSVHTKYWTKGDHLAVVKAMTLDERDEIKPQIQETVQVLQKLLAEIG